jgi:hypothetical protein
VVGFQENGSSFIIGSQENMYSNKGSVLCEQWIPGLESKYRIRCSTQYSG